MAKRQLKASELQGLDIYQDSKKGTLVYDIFTRNAYHLTSSDIQTYMLGKAILPISVLLVYIINMLTENLAFSFMMGALIYVACQLFYRFAWLYRLPCEKDYKRPGGNSLVDNLSSRYSKPSIIALVVMCTLLVLASLGFYLFGGIEGNSIYVLIFTAVLAGILDVLFIACLLKKR